MAYLNPQCAKCMRMHRSPMTANFCARYLKTRLCTDKERELVVIQDLQKMGRDQYGKLRTHVSYQNTWFF